MTVPLGHSRLFQTIVDRIYRVLASQITHASNHVRLPAGPVLTPIRFELRALKLSHPDGLPRPTAGVAEAGGDAEQQLQSLATRTGGSYTRTSTGDELTATLVALGTLPIPEPASPRAVATTITAPNHLAKDFQFPVDTDDVIVYLDEAPDREPLAEFVTVFPGETFSTDDVSIAEEYVSRIEQHRAEQENVLVVMPNRMVDVGLFTDAFAWYEVNTQTGATTAVTQDGLHAGAAAIELGGRVAGLWAGAESVMSSFLDCISPGCGEDLEAIKISLCGSISGDASVWASIVPDEAQDAYEDGVAIVEAACTTGITVGGLVQDAAEDEAQDFYDAQVGEATGAVVGWAQGFLLTLLGMGD